MSKTTNKFATKSTSGRCGWWRITKGELGSCKRAGVPTQVADMVKAFERMVDHCCEDWNKLVDPPWHIMSIGPTQIGASIMANAGCVLYCSLG